MNFIARILNPRSSLTDEQAMWSVQIRGDHEAFTELVRRWEEPIRRLCVRMTGDAHRGQDLAQETFARVFAQRSRFLHGSKFSTWLWRIALNLCHDEFRRIERRAELALETVDGQSGQLCASDPAPDESMAGSERAALVRRALLELTDSQRAVVVLREYEGLKFREIAEALDLPEGTVKWHMTEALNQLGRRLKPVLADNPRGRLHAAPPIPEKLVL